MKNRFLIRGGLFVSLSVLLMMTSCKKDAGSGTKAPGDDQSAQNASAAALSDSSATADYAYADVANNAFYGYADNAYTPTGRNGSGTVKTMSTRTNGYERFSCASITRLYTDTSIILTLDFGSGCVSPADSISRSGKVTYEYVGAPQSNGSTIRATFSNYAVNGYGLSGDYLLTNVSAWSPDSVTIFNTKIDNGVCSFPDGKSFTYSANKTYSTTTGTRGWNNLMLDSLHITGDSRFASAAGNTLTTHITTPLLKTLACRNIVSGILSFEYNGKTSGTVDFGNGDCDGEATVTIGSYSKTIDLH